MEKPLVSIIVPCFNTGKFIEKCIYSLLNQTYKNIEVIVIDQNEDDDTERILLRISDNDTRVKVIRSYHIKCTGTARNIGMIASSGSYICFVDSDDYVESNMIEVMCAEILSRKADMVYSNLYLIDYAGTNKIQKRIHNDYDNVSSEHRIYEFLDTPTAVNKIYCRKFLIKNRIFFPNLIFCEDILFMYLTIKYSSTTTYVDQAFYNVVLNRPGSSSTSPNPSAVYQLIEAVTAIIDNYRASNFYIKNKAAVDCALATYCYEHYIRFFYLKKITEESSHKFKVFIDNNFTDIITNKFYNIKFEFIYKQVCFYEELEKENNRFINKQNIIFSASLGGQRMFEYLSKKGIDVSYFMDNDENKSGSHIFDIEIILPKLIPNYDAFNIIIAADIKYYHDIKNQLINLGYNKFNIVP